MKVLSFEYLLNKVITEKRLHDINQYLLPEIATLNEALKLKYATPCSVINLPEDQDLISKINLLKEHILNLDPHVLIVIGIGGSSLGTQAVFEAIKGRLYNNLKPRVEFYCVDTIDDDYLSNLSSYIEDLLKSNKNIILNIVTKSGTTIETLANASVFLELLKKYKKNYEKYIYVTTDADSPLYYVAKLNNWVICEIPKLVGGRYSVFSAVSLLPLAVLDIDIKELLAGALVIRALCLTEDIFQNPASISAAISYLYFLDNKKIYDLFMFSPDFFSLGLWYRQLIAESLGKKYSRSGRLIETGINPSFSIGTQDLHSMLQLYLAGPQDKFITFLSIENENSQIEIPKNEVSQINPLIENKSLTFVKKSIIKSIKETFIEENRDFIVINLKEKNEYYIGQFLMLKIIHTIYLSRLLDVNPFDQPAVESYKVKAKAIFEES